MMGLKLKVQKKKMLKIINKIKKIMINQIRKLLWHSKIHH